MNSISKYWYIFCLILTFNESFCFRCDRRPYGTMTQPSPPDGRFKLDVLGTEDTYLPEQLYTVQIAETDGDSRFTAFMISVEGDTRPAPGNPRRTITLYPGELRPQTSETAKFSDRCLYSVEQTMNSYKSSVEVYWQAPSSGSGCVTLRAMVAENENAWYEDGTPLTRRLCEDMRQPDDVTPKLNYECQVCDEAKYELTFTGIWSRHSHPRLYPENDWIPRYSDLVGASHSVDFILWAPGVLASDGLKDLAEHANSSQLEAEIRDKIDDGVRTLIKGKGHGYRKMSYPTYSFFRVDKTNHLFTSVVSIHPSPDWFLGVTRFELCQEDNTWLQERELNLYPWDAGTDNGVSYESPNIETFPQDAVSRVQMSSYDKNSPFYEVDLMDLHPFGKLHIKLVRTYHRECEETPADTEENVTEKEDSEETSPTGVEPIEPSRYQNPEIANIVVGGEKSIETDPESPEDCPMSQWQEWSPCEGICEDGTLTGYKRRERYHLVDGVAVDKYDPDSESSAELEVPEFCKAHYEDFEQSECEEDCSNSNVKANAIAERRRTYEPIAPGNKWKSKKRNVIKSKE